MMKVSSFLKIVKLTPFEKVLLATSLSILSIILIFGIYNLLFLNKIYPGVSVAGIEISGKSPEETSLYLSEKIDAPISILLTTQGQEFEIKLSDIDFSYDFVKSAHAAYRIDRVGNILKDFLSRASAFSRNINLGLRVNINEEKLGQHLSVIASQVTTEPVQPSAEIVGDNVKINPGKPGTDVDTKNLRNLIGINLSQGVYGPFDIQLKTVDPALSEEEIKEYKARSEKLIGKSFNLKFEEYAFELGSNELVKFIDPRGKYLDGQIAKKVEDFSGQINRNPQNPILVFRGEKVKEFSPAKNGRKVKKDDLKFEIINNLEALEEGEQRLVSIDIPVEITPPEVKTGDINSLGINELLGRGVSYFAGSISSRVYNIGHASSKFNGVLIKPGETFSFNDALGDVSAYTGYKQAYIIKDGKTILGDGGGVCQVSTTFFRAVLDSGLPVVERRAHSYRVAYYEQKSPVGLDATVYAPTTDLKIENNTPGHLLIQTQVDPNTATLVFEIFGTSDGRTAEVSKSVVTNVVPPPEDLYQDDPTLPEGTIKQIDWKAWGAKVWFDYIVKKGGETIYEKTFYSNYRPWQAVYLRGTGP